MSGFSAINIQFGLYIINDYKTVNYELNIQLILENSRGLINKLQIKQGNELAVHSNFNFHKRTVILFQVVHKNDLSEFAICNEVPPLLQPSSSHDNAIELMTLFMTIVFFPLTIRILCKISSLIQFFVMKQFRIVLSI